MFSYQQNTQGMRPFNNFIDLPNLMEMPIQNGICTWPKEGGTISRYLLGLFFFSNKEQDEEFENTKVSHKAHTILITFPCCLQVGVVLQGLSPLRFYNRQLLNQDYQNIVDEAFSNSNFNGWANLFYMSS